MMLITDSERRVRLQGAQRLSRELIASVSKLSAFVTVDVPTQHSNLTRYVVNAARAAKVDDPAVKQRVVYLSVSASICFALTCAFNPMLCSRGFTRIVRWSECDVFFPLS